MRQFALHFRQHVIPRLHNLVRAEAVCIAHGVESFDNAANVVMRHAQHFGANCLPDIFELDDWITSTLLDEIIEAERGARERP